jgi:hypothetical protein
MSSVKSNDHVQNSDLNAFRAQKILSVNLPA